MEANAKRTLPAIYLRRNPWQHLLSADCGHYIIKVIFYQLSDATFELGARNHPQFEELTTGLQSADAERQLRDGVSAAFILALHGGGSWASV